MHYTTYLFAKLYFSKLRVWSYFSLCVKWAPNLLDRNFSFSVGKILWICFSFPFFCLVWQYLCIINDVISTHFVYTYVLYLVAWISMCSRIKVLVGIFLNFYSWKMSGLDIPDFIRWKIHACGNVTLARTELLCMKNAGTQWAIEISSNE